MINWETGASMNTFKKYYLKTTENCETGARKMVEQSQRLTNAGG